MTTYWLFLQLLLWIVSILFAVPWFGPWLLCL